MTRIEATDLEQIDALKRLSVQLQLGIASIDNATTKIYANDLLIEQGASPQEDPKMLLKAMVTTIMSLRRVSSHYIYTMTDIKKRTDKRRSVADDIAQFVEPEPQQRVAPAKNGQPVQKAVPIKQKVEPEILDEENEEVPVVEWKE